MNGRDAKNREFMDCLERWKEDHNQTDWNRMFVMVTDCCRNVALNKSRGIVNLWLDDRAMDGAVYSMQLIKRGMYPKNLTSFCYLNTIKYLYKASSKIMDRQVQLSALIEDTLEEDESEYGE